MKARNINKVITTNGNTTDIINVVMYAYEVENDPQIKELAEKLRGTLDIDTCRNIWRYLIDNVKYKADSDSTSGEMIRTPARMLVDGTGDCKSYSLFTAVVLRWLGIPHYFRFVSYSDKKEATHVYIIATSRENNKPVVIDAVANIQAQMPFNFELKYTYKCDMANSGTKISYLAGIPTYNRVGDVVNPKRYNVWIGDESEASVTPGKHFLYSLLDLNIEMYNIAKTTKDQLFYLDNLDVIASLIHAYNVVKGDTDQFKQIAFVICCMVRDGKFKSLELNVDARYENLDDLYTIIEGNYNSGFNYVAPDAELWNLILTEVIPYNKVSKNISGIHAGSETDVISKIKESGIYYIYMFISPAELAAMPAIVKSKITKQQKTFNWVAGVNTYQTPSSMQLSIRSGIVARTGKTPEQIIYDLKTGKTEFPNVGVVLITIATVVSIVIGLIQIIKLIWPAKDAAVQPSQNDITTGSFDPTTDFSTATTTSTSSLSSYALPLALGGAVLFGLFKIKK